MSINWILCLLLVSLLGLAVAYDVLQRRVPNWLVLAGLIAGAGFSYFSAQAGEVYPADGSGLGLYKSLMGALAGLAIMLPLYVFRVMGAGDVKLMTAIGTFVGPIPVAITVLLSFIAGGVLSLAAALWSGSLSRVVGNLRLMGLVLISSRASGLKLSDVQTTGRLPYAIAIAIGTGLQVWLAARGGWTFV